MRHTLERKREREDAAAVRGAGHRFRVDLGSSGSLRAERLLARVLGKPIALGRPVPRPTQCQQAGVLPGAVVLDLRRFGPALEVVFLCTRFREQAAHGM
jgi:hypothetical protein